MEELLPLQIFHTPNNVLLSYIRSIWGAPGSRYFTELQKAGFNLVLPGFNLKVWMFTTSSY